MKKRLIIVVSFLLTNLEQAQTLNSTAAPGGSSALSFPASSAVTSRELAQNKWTKQGFWDPKMADLSFVATNYYGPLDDGSYFVLDYYSDAAVGPDGSILATVNFEGGGVPYPVMAYYCEQTNCHAAALGQIPLSCLAIKVDGTNIFIGGEDGHANAAVFRWDGSNWKKVGGALGNGMVETLEVVGGQLYAGGYFTDSQGNTELIDRYDPSSDQWLSLGLINTSYPGSEDGGYRGTHALASLNGHLIVAGDFEAYSGTNGFFGIARLNGKTWENLGSELNPRGFINIFSLSACGTNLFVGGQFQLNGNTNYQGVAIWNASGWHIMDGAPHGNSSVDMGVVRAIQTRGDDVFIAGRFSTVGGGTVRAIGVAQATWNGTDQIWKWRDLDVGNEDFPDCLVLRNGTVPGQYDLFVGGSMGCGGGHVGSARIWTLGAGLWRVGYRATPAWPTEIHHQRQTAHHLP